LFFIIIAPETMFFKDYSLTGCDAL